MTAKIWPECANSRCHQDMKCAFPSGCVSRANGSRAPQQRLVPVEIDRKKHKHVLDVWNRSMEDMSSLDQTWPRLVEAISTPEPGTEYPCALSETTTNQRAACREDGSAGSSKPNGSQDSPAAAHPDLTLSAAQVERYRTELHKLFQHHVGVDALCNMALKTLAPSATGPCA